MTKLSTEERFWSKVNKTDGCWEWTCSTMHGYGRMSVGGKYKIAHRLAWEFTNGPTTDGMVIDHMCHTPKCVRPSHLREVTVAENIQNRKGAARDSATGIRGVSWDKAHKKWHVQLMVHGVNVYRAYFSDLEEATEAAKTAREKHLGYSKLMPAN